MDIVRRDPTRWEEILMSCGVQPEVASRHSPAFAEVLVPGAMSGGEEELDDFLGQILHESGLLRSMRENMNYTADGIRRVGMNLPAGSRWRSAANRAELLAHKPEDLANCVYAGRLGNGDEASGDGFKFRGGGHIQITGRAAYAEIGELIGVNLEDDPSLIEDPAVALRATIAWWERKVPDSFLGDVVRVTKRVNGGTLGIEHRRTVTERAAEALVASRGG